MSSSLPRVRKQADVCRRTINIKETQKHEKPLNNQGLSYVFHIVKQRWQEQKGSNPRHSVLEWLFNGENPSDNRLFKPFVTDF